MVGAASYWKKAARGGEVQAMYKLGSHFYHGDIPSLGRSGEDAVMWLQRFIKAVDAASASSSVASTKAPPSSPCSLALTFPAMPSAVHCYPPCYPPCAAKGCVTK